MARPTQLINDPNLLAAALEGLLLQKDRIEDQIRQLRALLGKKSPGRPAKSASAAASSDAKPRRRRKMSAAARKRIAEAQKKRWSEYRKQQKAD
jgi:hypothetical protein